jgi:hypothetical protein
MPLANMGDPGSRIGLLQGQWMGRQPQPEYNDQWKKQAQ